MQNEIYEDDSDVAVIALRELFWIVVGIGLIVALAVSCAGPVYAASSVPQAVSMGHTLSACYPWWSLPLCLLAGLLPGLPSWSGYVAGRRGTVTGTGGWGARLRRRWSGVTAMGRRPWLLHWLLVVGLALLVLFLIAVVRADADPGVMMVTAYTDCDPGMRCDGITASGIQTRLGVCACGSRYSFGTRFYIPALRRYYICYDRGNLVGDRNLDLWYHYRTDALEFGVKHLEVQIVITSEAGLQR